MTKVKLYMTTLGNDSVMIQDLNEQFRSIVRDNTRRQLGKTQEDICKEIVADFVSGRRTSTFFSATEVLGCVYSTQWNGTGPWKTANPYFVFCAIHHISSTDFLHIAAVRSNHFRNNIHIHAVRPTNFLENIAVVSWYKE